MTGDWFDSLGYVIRTVGRVGFVLLVYSLYRMYTIIATPKLKLRHRWFVNAFTLTIIVSFVLLIVEFILQSPFLSTVSMIFNTATTYVLAIYLVSEGNALENTHGSAEFTKYTQAMDELISTLKKR